MRVATVGHGTRPIEELLELLRAAGIETLVDVRRFPGSRRHPQFNKPALAAALATAGIVYRHAHELGGRLAGEPGEDRFGCIRVAAFRSYAARMATPGWQAALSAELAQAGTRVHVCRDTLDTLPPTPDRRAPPRARPRGHAPAQRDAGGAAFAVEDRRGSRRRPLSLRRARWLKEHRREPIRFLW